MVGGLAGLAGCGDGLVRSGVPDGREEAARKSGRCGS